LNSRIFLSKIKGKRNFLRTLQHIKDFTSKTKITHVKNAEGKLQKFIEGSLINNMYAQDVFGRN